MSAKTNQLFEIREDIAMGVLSFKAIAAKYNVDIYVVNLVWEEMCEQENAYA